MKKKLVWITPDYFVDCDIEIIPKLLKEFDIDWIVMIPSKDARFKREDFIRFENLKGLSFTYQFCKYRYRDPRYLWTYFTVFSKLIKNKADVIYLNYVPTPYFTVMAMLFFKRKKTILTAHQGEVHEGFQHQWVYKTLYKISYSWFNINNLFSKSQEKIFTKKYPDNDICMIPLALKSFGDSDIEKRDDFISFFTFGGIRPKKNIDLLIEAACLVCDKGYKNFKIVIAGGCDNWSFYQQKIRYPEVFELDIRHIENKEIPRLFAYNHFLVLPYSIVTQSGPLKIAYNYNVPVIVSNQPGFTDEVVDNISGYVFKTADVEDLANVLIKAINNGFDKYNDLVNKQHVFVNNTYSYEVILDQYIKMFNKF
ncbi:glycosyltransferase family 4 protein [Flavobacterium sp. MC2016-06]|uniref:glycosyltransferase family 4 protein n=1 Tax=Flavobacterium sp. MC2016-06 TaxID=2676308 RepID=UPI0012BA5F22|nr:glycosyltransferase family 4 protein [Flavobacterium sp. MC2016-06]MBU3862049.1 glycosyltransferase family 4 protein [Flavobacterium sp. MC2016-06]